VPPARLPLWTGRHNREAAAQAAVVTGASRGIGRAIGEMQAREGAKVELIARTPAEIEAMAERQR
jgi:short-subunit dehydrogenase